MLLTDENLDKWNEKLREAVEVIEEIEKYCCECDCGEKWCIFFASGSCLTRRAAKENLGKMRLAIQKEFVKRARQVE